MQVWNGVQTEGRDEQMEEACGDVYEDSVESLLKEIKLDVGKVLLF